VLLTVLLDADAVVSAVSGPDGALAERPDDSDLLWLQLSTVGVDGTTRLARLGDEARVTFVDAPVLGTKQPAEQGKLTVLASGPDDARDRCAPVFDAIGQRSIWCGPAGRGSRLKLAVNSWVLALTTATAEALALARGLDLDPRLFLESIEGGPLDVAYAHVKGGQMLEENFPAAFPLAGAVKDSGLILDAAELAGVRLRVADAVQDQMRTAADAGHSAEDMAAVWYAALAG
jgi:3-hydroxyisobutyrate dehydrogenase